MPNSLVCSRLDYLGLCKCTHEVCTTQKLTNDARLRMDPILKRGTAMHKCMHKCIYMYVHMHAQTGYMGTWCTHTCTHACVHKYIFLPSMVFLTFSPSILVPCDCYHKLPPT
jgi:hypothetical protein